MNGIYAIDQERVSVKRRLARVVLLAVLAAIGTYMFRRVWPSPKPESTHFEDYAVGEFGVLLSAFLFESARAAYALEITDDIMQTRGGMHGTHKVRRGRIRYFREHSGNFFREPALYLSEHSGVPRFLFGYVLNLALCSTTNKSKQGR
ncbi:MAG: hypothetical protein ACRD3P_14560 [Terriglobales bacterium]